jgi:type II secretory pathway pseudopilin PulG
MADSGPSRGPQANPPHGKNGRRVPYWLEVVAVVASIVSSAAVVVGLIYAGVQLHAAKEGLRTAQQQLEQERKTAETNFTANAVKVVAEQEVLTAYYRLQRLANEIERIKMRAKGRRVKGEAEFNPQWPEPGPAPAGGPGASCDRAMETVYASFPPAERRQQMLCDVNLVFQRYFYVKVLYEKNSADKTVINSALYEELGALKQIAGSLGGCLEVMAEKFGQVAELSEAVLATKESISAAPLEQASAEAGPGGSGGD